MTTRTNIFIAAAFLAVVSVGCQRPQQRKPAVAITPQTIAVEDLAARLGLQVTERDETFIVLKNPANTVILFTQTDGRFFVNGRALGAVGTVERTDRTVRVPLSLATDIRTHLRTAAPAPPAVAPPRRPTTRSLVVIDAGHGGHDPGTISPIGLQEKNINLRVAAKIARLLEQRGLGVLMTRWQDRFLELEERADIANRRETGLFVSIHSDSAPSRDARGFTVYVANAASSEAWRAARAISGAMDRTGLDSRGIHEADYRVLVQTNCPAVLVELGYLSNPQDAARLANDSFRDRLAEAIADGITAYMR